MSIKYQDFVGFTFNGRHSSEFNILRVSQSSRYTDLLVPEFQDQTLQIKGRDGIYYWKTNDTKRSFNLSVAFDSITEQNLHNLRKWLNSKTVGDLIFDELPYKKYSVKIESTPQFKFICFDDINGQRIYKGEGTINFVSYKSKARQTIKYLSQAYVGGQYNVGPLLDRYHNLKEWEGATSFLTTQGSYDNVGHSEVVLYNAGDVETDIKIFIPFETNPLSFSLSFKNSAGVTTNTLICRNISRKDINDEYICVNTYNHLIEGANSNFNITNNVYNIYHTSGTFTKIPVGESYISIDSSLEIDRVEYDYLFY